MKQFFKACASLGLAIAISYVIWETTNAGKQAFSLHVRPQQTTSR